jgi:hypothetical protein
MDGYRYLIERNRLMQRLEDDLAGLSNLPEAERQAETKRLQAKFDAQLAEMYAGVASEFHGERRKKARPITDPR